MHFLEIVRRFKRTAPNKIYNDLTLFGQGVQASAPPIPIDNFTNHDSSKSPRTPDESAVFFHSQL